jgi:hypothetical protein
MWGKSMMGGSAALAAGLMGAGAAEAHDLFRLHWPPVWETAVAVPNVSSPLADGCPIESADGLSLFIASARDGDINDIYAADRASLASPWATPRKLEAPINIAGVADFCPTPVRGRSLMFVSSRPGACAGDPGGTAGGDIYIARQSPAGGWSEPTHLGCAPDGPNSAGGERSPSLVETPYGTFLYYSTNGTTGHQDIHVSVMRQDGTFGPGKPVDALNTTAEDIMPNVHARELGGYEIVYSSNRPTNPPAATPNQDVYIAFSWFLPGPWSKPVNVGPAVNTVGTEQRSTLSNDGQRLYFGRNGDIFVSQRKR